MGKLKKLFIISIQLLPMCELSAQRKIIPHLEDWKFYFGHSYDIKKRGNIFVNFDYKQKGGGGGCSWYACTHPEYTLMEREYHYTFFNKYID